MFFEWKDAKQELGVVKSAPLSFLFFVVVGVVIGVWYSNGQIKALRESVATYEVRLNVGSPDEAAMKMTQMQTDLEIISKQFKALASAMTETASVSWAKPICLSRYDTMTMGTARQILAYNSALSEVSGTKTFSEYCTSLDEAFNDEETFKWGVLPDVKEYKIEILRKAADEVEKGACPALTLLVKDLQEMRDQTRIAK